MLVIKQQHKIGLGPGICGYSAKYKSSTSGVFARIEDAIKRRYNKYIGRPRLEKRYVQSVANAIRNGFHWIDYSCAYGDGKLIGEAIKQSGVKREELIITTRVSNHAQRSF